MSPLLTKRKEERCSASARSWPRSWLRSRSGPWRRLRQRRLSHLRARPCCHRPRRRLGQHGRAARRPVRAGPGRRQDPPCRSRHRRGDDRRRRSATSSRQAWRGAARRSTWPRLARSRTCRRTGRSCPSTADLRRSAPSRPGAGSSSTSSSARAVALRTRAGALHPGTGPRVARRSGHGAAPRGGRPRRLLRRRGRAGPPDLARGDRRHRVRRHPDGEIWKIDNIGAKSR